MDVCVTVCTSGRYVLVVAPRTIRRRTHSQRRHGARPSAVGHTFGQADFGAATISVYGQTVEETGTDTTSASGPVTVTLANKYAALRDLQVTAVQSGGTAVVTADAISLSTTLANTFQINATVSGARSPCQCGGALRGAVTAYTTSRPDGGQTGTPFSQSIRDNFEAIRQAMVIGGLGPRLRLLAQRHHVCHAGRVLLPRAVGSGDGGERHHRPVTAGDVVSHHQYMVVWRADEAKARDQHQRRQQLQQLDRPCWQLLR